MVDIQKWLRFICKKKMFHVSGESSTLMLLLSVKPFLDEEKISNFKEYRILEF